MIIPEWNGLRKPYIEAVCKSNLHCFYVLSGQATDALNYSCEDKLIDGNKDLMQFFEEIIKW